MQFFGNNCMNFRVTNKIAKKLKLSEYTIDKQTDYIFFETWFVNLFRADKKEYIISTEATSLFSIVIEGVGVTNTKWFEAKFNKYLIEYANEQFLNEKLEIYYMNKHQNFYYKTNDKKIIGSQNDLIYNAIYHLEYDELDFFETSIRINQMPMSLIKYNPPEIELRSKIGAAIPKNSI